MVSAHRTPERLCRVCRQPRKARGLKVIIAGAGGAAHLPGMAAAMTPCRCWACRSRAAALKGLDSLLSIVQMPGGVPVGTLAIGKAGAINAALLRGRASWRLGDAELRDAAGCLAARTADRRAVPERPHSVDA